MSEIFDLRKEPSSWADSVNESLAESFPEYFEKFGKVGSAAWWNKYDNDEIPIKRSEGVVTFIGKRTDQFNEEWDVVELNENGNLVECDFVGYWRNSEIALGKSIYTESFEISFNQKYGPMKYIFESLVRVNEI